MSEFLLRVQGWGLWWGRRRVRGGRAYPESRAGSLSTKHISTVDVTHAIHSLLPPHVLVVHSFMQQISIM